MNRRSEDLLRARKAVLVENAVTGPVTRPLLQFGRAARLLESHTQIGDGVPEHCIGLIAKIARELSKEWQVFAEYRGSRRRAPVNRYRHRIRAREYFTPSGHTVTRMRPRCPDDPTLSMFSADKNKLPG